MQKPLLQIAIIISLLPIIGCSNKIISFSELDKILAPTETNIKDRTPEWYASQDQVTPKVLDACLYYFFEKSHTLGGQYESDIYNDAYSKFSEIPDCLNARKGEIQNMGKTKTPLTESQLNNIEIELKKPESAEHINKLAQDVANRLNQQSTNSINEKPVFEQFEDEITTSIPTTDTN